MQRATRQLDGIPSAILVAVAFVVAMSSPLAAADAGTIAGASTAPDPAMAPVDWQDRIVARIGDETLGNAPLALATAGERELALDLAWWLPGKDLDEAFPLAGHTVADGCARLAQRLGVATMVLDGVPVFLAREQQALLQAPIRIPAGIRAAVDTVDAIAKASGLALELDPHIVATTLEPEDEPALAGTALAVLTAWTRRELLMTEWRPAERIWRITWRPAAAPILPPVRPAGTFTINGPGRARALVRIPIAYDEQPVADILRDLARRLGVPLRLDPRLAATTMSMQVPRMRACDALAWIAAVPGAVVREQEGMLVVEPAPAETLVLPGPARGERGDSSF